MRVERQRERFYFFIEPYTKPDVSDRIMGKDNGFLNDVVSFRLVCFSGSITW